MGSESSDSKHPADGVVKTKVGDYAEGSLEARIVSEITNAVSEITDGEMEVIDCTKSNADLFTKSFPKNKKNKKKVSDVVIFNDIKKGGDITCKVIRSNDGPRPKQVSPKKKDKKG